MWETLKASILFSLCASSAFDGFEDVVDGSKWTDFAGRAFRVLIISNDHTRTE